MSYTWRPRLLAIGIGAILTVVAAVFLLGNAPSGLFSGQTVWKSPPKMEAVVLSSGPVTPGSRILVCPIVYNSSTMAPINTTVAVKITSDQYYWEEQLLRSNTCSAVEVKRVVTNQLWVDVCLGNTCLEKTLGATGKIMLATSDVITLLVALNLLQFAVIVVLILKMRGTFLW